MRVTIAERVMAATTGMDSMKPGDVHTMELDRLMSNDDITHLAIDTCDNKPKNLRIADARKLTFIVDHNVPADNPKIVASRKKMRNFTRENKIDFQKGKGVYRQIIMGYYVCPDELIFGADNHIRTYGALGVSGAGVGCADFLCGMIAGTFWVLVPETIKLSLVRRLPEGIYPRNLMLTTIEEVGANECNYQMMEFTGEDAGAFSISNRMMLCNLAVEAGTKTGISEVDEAALEYLRKRGREPKAVSTNDPNTVCVRGYIFDLSKIQLVVAKPDFMNGVVPTKDVCGAKINGALLGSYSNGRIEELWAGAELLKDRKVADSVRFLVVPANPRVCRQVLEEGPIDIFIEAGAIVTNPSCNVCWGSCQGVIGENEALISTGAHNSKGQAGHSNSKVYLRSAIVITASAIANEITLAN